MIFDNATDPVIAMSLAMRKHLQIYARKASKGKTRGNKDMVKFRAQGFAPSPSRDFFELLVFEESLLWRTWRVKNSREVTFLPSEQRISLDDFPDNKSVCSLIRINLGEDVLDITHGFCLNDWLQRLPIAIFSRLANHLSTQDLCTLCQVSKCLNIKSANENIWKKKFLEDFHSTESRLGDSSSKMQVVADPIKLGWKRAYKVEYRRRLISWK